MPWFGPCALLGLLYTIVVMFASQNILSQIGNVARVAVPMLIYFMVMFFASFALSYWCKMSYEFSVTQVGVSYFTAQEVFRSRSCLSWGSYYGYCMLRSVVLLLLVALGLSPSKLFVIF
eukprot:GHRQ01017245.1.p2 GENE.GHRQ01017245.1~~GHRQ01017245.1.p2  ORF type:complete len:119 (-),score=19.25 GHRQ01017245.1:283-639(-)